MKYELTEDVIEFDGARLIRIRATKDFSDVKEGTLGGYIEKEKNLSHFMDCWIYNDAKVYNDAKAYHNTKIKDNAILKDKCRACHDSVVSGNAIISGGAWISNKAQVRDSAQIKDKVKIFGDAEIYKDVVINKNAWIGQDNRICDTRQFLVVPNFKRPFVITKKMAIFGCISFDPSVFETGQIEDCASAQGVVTNEDWEYARNYTIENFSTLMPEEE